MSDATGPPLSADDTHSRRERGGEHHRLSRRSRLRHHERAVKAAPWSQFVPGLGQALMRRPARAAIGLASVAIALIGVGMLAVGLLIDRRIGLGWVTQETPLLIIALAALALSAIWFVLGVDHAVPLVRSRHALRAAFVGVLAVAQLAAGLTILSTANAQREFLAAVFPTGPTVALPDRAEPAPAPTPESVLEGRYNILLLGGDAGEGRWGLRPDSISVLSVDVETGATAIIGVPRNLQNAPFSDGSPLWGPWPGGYDCGGGCLISYLYTYGSGHPELFATEVDAGRDPGIEATRDAVEGVLGIEIPYAVLIDMAGFAQIVDAVGGIDVCVPVETLAQDRRTVFPAGCQHMDGAAALLYSRTRYDSDDYGRMFKQRLVQQALLAQADPITVLLNFQQLTATGARYVKTDIPQDLLTALVDVALRAREATPVTLELSPPTIDVVNPDFARIHALVAEVLG